MKTIEILTKKSNIRFVWILLGAGILLLIPAILQLTIGSGVVGKGFNWKTDDFLVITVLLLGTALLSEFVSQKVTTLKFRMVIGAVNILVFLLIWTDLTLGIVNIPGFSGN